MATEEPVVAGVAVTSMVVLGSGNMLSNRSGWFAREQMENPIDGLIDDLLALEHAEKQVEVLQDAQARDTVADLKLKLEQFSSNLGGSATYLHHQVEHHKWSVTRNDFNSFARAARLRWERGKIPNPNPDKHRLPGHADPHENPKIGPSMYEVNEHVVKWATRQVGGVSWALMCHPQGLDCDLFVSHAWCEGVFEFVNHVLKAWPWHAKQLWCCSLAIPQCGGIVDDLINGRPINESPFARALKCAPHVIVVPNQSGSVYRRLWCVYEMSLAIDQNKVISMPTLDLREVLKGFVLIYGGCCTAILLGACTMMFMQFAVIHYKLEIHVCGGESLLSWPMVATVSLWREHLRSARRMIIYILFFLAGLFGGGLDRLFFFIPRQHGEEQPTSSAADEQDLANVLPSLLMEAFSLQGLLFMFAAADIYDELYVDMELHAGKHGSVTEAQCTRSEDGDKIRTQIEGSEARIDEAIQTLIQAGSYNSEIQKLAVSRYPLQRLRHNPVAFVFPVHMMVLMVFEVFIINGEKKSNKLWQLLMLLLGVLTAGRWAAYILDSQSWEKYLWLRRLDQTSWLLAGAHYVVHIFAKYPSIWPWLRDILVQPLWFCLPLSSQYWRGADLNLTSTCLVIVALAFAHLQTVFIAAGSQHILLICAAATVASSFLVILRRLLVEDWQKSLAIARRVILTSLLSLILSDILQKMPALKTAIGGMLGLVGSQITVKQVMQCMGATLSFLAPMINLLALRDSLWQDRSAREPVVLLNSLGDPGISSICSTERLL